MSGMTAEEKLLEIDNDAANKYVRKYERHLGAEKDATAQMLESAIGKFYKFLEIPPASDRFLDIISGAWTVLSTFVPLLGGIKMAENVFVLCVRAEELTIKMAPVMRAGQRLASAADRISPTVGKAIEITKKTNETYTTTKEAITRMAEVAPEPTKAFGNLEIAKAIRVDFINTLYLRMAAIDKAEAALHGEYSNRVFGKKSNPDVTLEAMAKRLLPIPTDLIAIEYDQLETTILYQTISLYMQRKITFTRNVIIDRSLGSPQRIEDREEDYEIDSINSNQIAMFAKWFGNYAMRGKYYNPPFAKLPIESDEYFFRRIMKMLNCKVIDKVSNVFYGRHRGEL